MVRSSTVFIFLYTPVFTGVFCLDFYCILIFLHGFLHSNLHMQNLSISFIHKGFLNSGRTNLHSRFFGRGTCARDDADDGKNFMKNQNNEVRVMRLARRRQSLTQLDLARLVGCTESMVSRMETGRTYADDAELKARVAEVLGIETWEVGV